MQKTSAAVRFVVWLWLPAVINASVHLSLYISSVSSVTSDLFFFCESEIRSITLLVKCQVAVRRHKYFSVWR